MEMHSLELSFWWNLLGASRRWMDLSDALLLTEPLQLNSKEI